MDLANLDTARAGDDGAVMEVCHPVTGAVLKHDDGRPFTVTVASYDSKRWRDASRAQIDKRLKEGRKATATAESLERDGVDLLVAATIAWDVVIDGNKPECKPDVVREVYGRFRWLREQVDLFAADRGNFIKA